MATRIMGMEIGSSTIKLIEVSRHGARLTVHKCSVIETPKECIYNGVISNIEPIQEAIGKELKAQKYRAKKVVAVVQSSNIIIRNAFMEKQPEKVIKQILEIKTEEFLPIEKSQYQIDFKVLGEVKEEEGIKNKLELVAAPNNVVGPVAALIKNLNLIPVCITIPSEALVNIFSSESRMIYENTGNVMVLDIGGHSTTATIVEENGEALTRMIEYGLTQIEEGAKSTFHVEEENSEAYFSNVIRPEIEYHILSEVERILQFYYSNHQSRQVKKIYLTGGGSAIKGLRSYMRDALNIPTEKISQLDTVMIAPGVEFEHYTRFFVNTLGAINGL